INTSIAEVGAIEYDGNSLYMTNSSSTRGRVFVARSIISSAGTLGLSSVYSHYVFSGTTTTWTLPVISGNTAVVFFIKNRGSGSITLNSNAGGNDIYDTSAVNTISIAAGAARRIWNDGTYWLAE